MSLLRRAPEVKIVRPERVRRDLDREIAHGSPASMARASRSAQTPKKSSAGAKKRAEADIDLITPGSPWAVNSARFPRYDNIPAQVRFCLRYAVLAPSSHNSQPWKFRIDGTAVEVLADRTRALPVVDPLDRELTISVGCAIEYLLVALRRFGLVPKLVLTPDPREHDLMARIELKKTTKAVATSVEDEQLVNAMPKRRTTRHAFAPVPVPDALLPRLVSMAQERDGSFTLVTGARPRQKLAKLIAEADELQLASRQFRRELALWMHHNRSHASDGIPGYAMGMSEVASLISPLIVRTFDIGHGRAAKDEDLALHSPVLAIIGTPGDAVEDWLNAGRALSAVLLKAASEGVTASYLNQPVEVPELRPRLARFGPEVGHAQLVLRMGYGPPVRHTPRRGLEQVVLRSTEG